MRAILVWAVAAIAIGSAFGWGAEIPATTNVSPSTIPSIPEILLGPPAAGDARDRAAPTLQHHRRWRQFHRQPRHPRFWRRTPVGGQLAKVVVTSDLDLSRDQIAPSLGATTYTEGPEPDRIHPRRGQRHFPAGGAPSPRRRHGFLRPGTRPRRTRQHHLPRRRRSSSAADQHLRPGTRYPHGRNRSR